MSEEPGEHQTPGRHRIKIPERLAGRRLDEILEELCPERSRAASQKLVRRGGVKLDGKRVLRSNIRPQRGGALSIVLEAGGASPPAVPALRAALVYQDEHLAVFDKPSGLLVHGNEKQAGGTLAEQAEDAFGPLPLLMGEERPGVVHRLDRETSGLIVLARTVEAMEGLREQFRAREVSKLYLALVHGAPERECYDLDWDLGPSPSHPDRQLSFGKGQAKAAFTRIESVERLGFCSLLECRPRTGRRHQIRVHLHAARTPVVGDKLYGAKHAPALPPGAPSIRRHCLHAAGLTVCHPISGAELRLEAPLPTDMGALVDWLRSHGGAASQ